MKSDRATVRRDRYANLMKQAGDALGARNFDAARNFAEQARGVNAGRSEAYDMIGHVDLYHDLDFASAERNFRAALARGGNATFRVHHDHSSLTGPRPTRTTRSRS